MFNYLSYVVPFFTLTGDTKSVYPSADAFSRSAERMFSGQRTVAAGLKASLLKSIEEGIISSLLARKSKGLTKGFIGWEGLKAKDLIGMFNPLGIRDLPNKDYFYLILSASHLEKVVEILRDKDSTHSRVAAPYILFSPFVPADTFILHRPNLEAPSIGLSIEAHGAINLLETSILDIRSHATPVPLPDTFEWAPQKKTDHCKTYKLTAVKPEPDTFFGGVEVLLTSPQ